MKSLLNGKCTMPKTQIHRWFPFLIIWGLSACSLESAQEKATQTLTQAKSLLTKLQASECASAEAHRQILRQSGFYTNDPVRGPMPIAGLTVSLTNAREDTEQADRVICLANFEIRGPRSILLEQSFTTNWSDDARFAIDEISLGFGGESSKNNGLWGLLGNVTTVSLLAMAQAFEENADSQTPTTFSSPIEFAVYKDKPKEEALKAWAWIPGSSPGYHAGFLMRELQEAREKASEAPQ